MADDVADPQPSSDDDAPSLLDRAEALLRKVRSQRRRVSRVRNLLREVEGKKPSAANYAAWLDLMRGLDGYELGVPALDEARGELVAGIDGIIEKLRIKARMAFMTRLQMLADQQELELDKVSEAPLVFYVAPLTFEIDFDAGSARLLYGHEPIEDVPLDAAALIEARRKAVAQMRQEAVDSEVFFDRLRSAYRMVLGVAGDDEGARVDLVDVRLPLSMLEVGRNKWRHSEPDDLQGYPRHQLAFQLARLRRDGVLERGGVRLDLGAATGGSTRDKSDVLFIPVGPKNGQYYGSIRFG